MRKAVFHKIVAKVNRTDIIGYVLKSKYNIFKSYLEEKISDAG